MDSSSRNSNLELVRGRFPHYAARVLERQNSSIKKKSGGERSMCFQRMLDVDTTKCNLLPCGMQLFQ